MTSRLRNYTEDEIDILLDGDRREVDRLLLHSLSTIAAVLIPHVEKEDTIFEAMGDIPTIRMRSAWIESQIVKQNTKNQMMRRVAEAGVIMCVLGFIGFVGYSLVDYVIDILRAKIIASQSSITLTK